MLSNRAIWDEKAWFKAIFSLMAYQKMNVNIKRLRTIVAEMLVNMRQVILLLKTTICDDQRKSAGDYLFYGSLKKNWER